jgi:hypothetical protein
MSFLRFQAMDKGEYRPSQVGDGLMMHPKITTNAAAGNQAITTAAILGGVALFTGAAGAVDYTVPTAAAILAVMPEMDIGDTYAFALTNTAAQAATIVTNTGVTLAGFTTLNAATRTCIIERTAAATVTITTI